MDALVGATQHIGIHNLGEFSEFYRKFCTIVEYLAKQNCIGARKIATNFLRALPVDLQQKIIFRIQICDPNRHVDKPHTLKSLFEAGVHILEGTMILDMMNPYVAAAAYVQPQSQAGQMHQPVQQAQVNYPHNAYIPGTSILSPYRFYAPPVVPSPQFPYAQQTVPVHQPAPPAAQPNTFQPLPYTPGLKQEDIMTIATMVVSVFAKQLTPLFQQQPRGSATTNAGQNCTMFTCVFCSQAGHGIRDCNIAQTYITENRIQRENGKLVMPDGSQIMQSRPGEALKDCIDRVQPIRTSVVFEIVSPAAQEALADQATSQVNIQTQVDGDKQDKINADIESYEFAIYELKKRKQKFNGIELPAPHNKGKNRENAPANTAASSTAPRLAAPAQPAPAIVPKPAKPFAPTTFEPPKPQQPPHEPNFPYAAPIEDKAISTALYNRMLNVQFTVTGHEILATAPEVRRSMKDTTTTCKVPTTVNTAKAYVDTNTRSANQVQLCCHKVHCNLLVAKESHALRAITPKIEGLHEVESILDSRSQIVSISEAVWCTLNRKLNPLWKITMQLANGSRDKSLGLIENLELEIGGMKLFVQAHIIRNPAYDVLLGRPFDILTALHIKNYHNELQTITLTDANSGKMVSIPTVPRGQPRFKMPLPEGMNQDSF
jgi:hypothetical protein